ncbi:MAG: transposase [Candidatus Rokubacteria bacterium CSP1-6]|nr:MAG: transposase [Candidatus Rokubacteria bacterium CSP1-6]
MGEHTRKRQREHENRFSTLGELIHAQVRRAIETAVHEELLAALGAAPWERSGARRGYRNGDKERTLTGPTGPLPLTLPRGTMPCYPEVQVERREDALSPISTLFGTPP